MNQAHGMCFSVRPGIPAPPSLKTMYKALKMDYPDTFNPPPNNSGYLMPWADQGVLLLNTCLTVQAHKAASHAGKGWERLTQRAIDTVVKTQKKGVVFLAWGAHAQKRTANVASPNLVLKSKHPSPMATPGGAGFVSDSVSCSIDL
jgi:uracil-DNA glycosylase